MEKPTSGIYPFFEYLEWYHKAALLELEQLRFKYKNGGYSCMCTMREHCKACDRRDEFHDMLRDKVRSVTIDKQDKLVRHGDFMASCLSALLDDPDNVAKADASHALVKWSEFKSDILGE